ncbi:unnamed protein product [Cochlearia groenlandica]
MAIFNPSTRKIHRLPIEPVDFSECLITRDCVFYGLGYDSVNDDYKAVRMIQCELLHGMDPVSFEIKMFSLKRNSWRRISLRSEIKMLFFYFYYHVLYRHGNGVVANNGLHWILTRRQGHIAFNTILRFDLATEEFEVVSFPSDLYCESLHIDVLDGCLCLMSYDEFSHVDVWIMEEYTVKGSWPKLFTVPKPEGVESFELVRPLLYSEDRSKVLLEVNNAKNLLWFDLASKGFTRLEIKDCDSPYSVELVVSSLVLGCKGDPTKVVSKKSAKRYRKKGNGYKQCI